MSRREKGFTLIEIIIGTALMLVLFLALLGVLRISLILATVTKAKAAAVEMANTQVEYLRGLSYDSLGTVGGIPAGTIPQLATSTVDGTTYVTRTYIQYQDDPADGVGAADTNNVTTDYKIAKVVVSYSLYGLPKSLTIVSNFVPPGIESSTGGGTLTIHVVNAASADVNAASVLIVNASTTPTVNLATLSDTGGYVALGGVATSTQYQISVTRPGYSTAQTYARTLANPNPTPGYFTIVKDQTTSATFAIDRLATVTFASFSFATTTVFSDIFANSVNLANQTKTEVVAGKLILENDPYPVGYSLSGSARSIAIAPNYLTGWGILSATLSQPAGTTAVVHLADGAGNLLPDAALAGNTAGFSAFPVSLTGVSTTTYPSLTLRADLTTNATTTASAVLDWSLSHTEGPAPISNISFTLTGTKTIGTTTAAQPIYKTILTDSTGASSVKSETLEWDGYTLTVNGTTLNESCPDSPFSVAPAQVSTTTMIVGSQGTNYLPLEIDDNMAAVIPYAKVVLTKAGFAATQIASACGNVYFNAIPAGTYTATVTAAGASQAFPNLSVNGREVMTVLTMP